MDRKIWLTNPPILHTILYQRKKKKKNPPNSSLCSPNVCNQRFMKIVHLKSLKKKKKKNQKAFDHSLLSNIGRSTLKQT